MLSISPILPREDILVDKLTKQNPLILQIETLSRDLLTDLSGLESKESQKKKESLKFFSCIGCY